MNARRGRFITFEGGEGAGKSTQLGRLRDRVAALGREVVTTREPGGSPRAERIRALVLAGHAKRFGPFAETLLFASARADHIDRVIRPALLRGAVVICDRFIDSTRVYQGVLGHVSPETITTLERVTLNGLEPDATLIFDVPASVGMGRAIRRRQLTGDAADRFEAEGAAFHTGIAQAFRDIAASEPRRCRSIDADGTPDTVAERVWDAVRSLIEEGQVLGG